MLHISCVASGKLLHLSAIVSLLVKWDDSIHRVVEKCSEVIHVKYLTSLKFPITVVI